MRRSFTPEFREVIAFILFFLVSKTLLSSLLTSVASFLGLGDVQVAGLLMDFEMPLQVIPLVIAHGLVLGQHFKRTGRRGAPVWPAVLRKLLPLRRSEARLSEIIEIAANASLKSFVFVSGLVALSSFLGFAQIERIHWTGVVAWLWLPQALLQATLLVLWVWALEITRRFLWERLVHRSERDLQGRLIVILFEATLLFRLFNNSPFLADQLFLAVVCALVSASLLLWFEAGRKDWQSDLRRLSFLSGLWVSLFHIYGYERSGSRLFSLAHVFAGPELDPLGGLVRQGVFGQTIFILGGIVLINALLHKSLRPSRLS